ncbi:MAG: ABC transporter ATP-binding protein, partial [Bacilli bacterium]|nr:ABC transporter ATP-binding protein [Bacilli bacterium]
MLRLDKIKKTYKTSDMEVQALKGVSLNFRKNEFVSILGPSGCGKTTLLNVIGGLDHYDGGDLLILGKSTKDFKDHDWDVYRNHRIGFVFQSYNLIPQNNVQQNVELGLTISGMSKKDREKLAREALDKVGLKGLYRKLPNQLSGGQCQRVAIARAIVNNPDIILADEPTGALDSVTSVQIMDILKEISLDRLVIMVTHNPDLAEKYSTRIINLLDGEVIGDSSPFSTEEEAKEWAELSSLGLKS